MNKIILSLDLREGLFTLNEGTIEALGRPRQVQILINMQEKMSNPYQYAGENARTPCLRYGGY